MLLRRKKENEEGGFEGSEEGLDPGPDRGLQWKAEGTPMTQKTEIKTYVEIKFFRG